MQTEYLLEVQVEMLKHVAGGTIIVGFSVLRCLLLPQNRGNEVKVLVSGERNCEGGCVSVQTQCPTAAQHSSAHFTGHSSNQHCAATDRCTPCCSQHYVFCMDYPVSAQTFCGWRSSHPSGANGLLSELQSDGLQDASKL